MIIRYFVAAFIITIIMAIVAFYMLNDWVTSHALALTSYNDWALQAKGWSGLWPTIAVGLIAGLAVGVTLGVLISRKLANALNKRRELAEIDTQKELDKQRRALARKEAEIDARIKSIAEERISAIQKQADALAIENEKARTELLRLKKKSEIIEGRLKGAQQKAARIKKKAQLTSLQEAKPADGYM